ncbi:4603_t:CDS:2, partial [Dentiscutata erythropus]
MLDDVVAGTSGNTPELPIIIESDDDDDKSKKSKKGKEVVNITNKRKRSSLKKDTNERAKKYRLFPNSNVSSIISASGSLSDDFIDEPKLSFVGGSKSEKPNNVQSSNNRPLVTVWTEKVSNSNISSSTINSASGDDLMKGSTGASEHNRDPVTVWSENIGGQIIKSSKSLSDDFIDGTKLSFMGGSKIPNSNISSTIISASGSLRDDFISTVRGSTNASEHNRAPVTIWSEVFMSDIEQSSVNMTVSSDVALKNIIIQVPTSNVSLSTIISASGSLSNDLISFVEGSEQSSNNRDPRDPTRKLRLDLPSVPRIQDSLFMTMVTCCHLYKKSWETLEFLGDRAITFCLWKIAGPKYLQILAKWGIGSLYLDALMTSLLDLIIECVYGGKGEPQDSYKIASQYFRMSWIED